MRKLQGTLLAGAAAAALVVTAPTAEASTFLGNETYKSVRTGNCIADLTEGLSTAPCNGKNYQLWGVYAAPNIRAFKNVQTGRCIQGGDDGRVMSVVCHGSPYQQFHILHYSDGRIAMRREGTNNCITVQSNNSLRLAACNGTSSQRFF